jgi:hypothetical protein
VLQTHATQFPKPKSLAKPQGGYITYTDTIIALIAEYEMTDDAYRIASDKRHERLRFGEERLHASLILADFSGTRRTERALHRRFGDYRREGEWCPHEGALAH